MISLWRRTLEPTDLRVELRDGDIVMGHFDNRKKALDWLWEHVANEEVRITERLSEIADQQVLLVLLQEDVQEMRDFLCAAERKFGFPSSNPETRQPKWFAAHNTTKDASGLEGKLPKALLEPPDRRTLQARVAELEDEVEALKDVYEE